LENDFADCGEHHLVDYHGTEHYELHGLRTVLMDDGRWKMEDGRWKMEDGRWKMEDGGMRDEG